MQDGIDVAPKIGSNSWPVQPRLQLSTSQSRSTSSGSSRGSLFERNLPRVMKVASEPRLESRMELPPISRGNTRHPSNSDRSSRPLPNEDRLAHPSWPGCHPAGEIAYRG